MASIFSAWHHRYPVHQDYGAKAVPETKEKQLSIVPHYRNGQQMVGREMKTSERLELWSGVSLGAFDIV